MIGSATSSSRIGLGIASLTACCAAPQRRPHRRGTRGGLRQNRGRIEIQTRRREGEKRGEAAPEPPPDEAKLAEAQGLKHWQYGDGTRNTLAEFYRSVKFLQVIRVPEKNTQIRMVDSQAIALQTTNALLARAADVRSVS